MKKRRGPKGDRAGQRIRRRNPAVAAVHSPRFRPKVVGSGKRYRRAAHKRLRPNGDEDADDGGGTARRAPPGPLIKLLPPAARSVRVRGLREGRRASR